MSLTLLGQMLRELFLCVVVHCTDAQIKALTLAIECVHAQKL